jgi:hypothetical protein
MRKILAFGLCFSVLATVPVAAQEAHQFQIGPRLGMVKYNTNTGIKSTSALIGLDGLFSVTPNLGLGFRLDLSRPLTDGTFFPAEMTFRDTTELFAVSQPLTIVQYSAKAEFGTGGSMSFFVNGSVGGYRITLDPQVANGLKNVQHLGFGFGGGLAIQASSTSHLRLEVADAMWTKFDRADLNPVGAAFAPAQFPEAIPAKAPFSGSVSNLQFSLAFWFTPGGER